MGLLTFISIFHQVEKYEMQSSKHVAELLSLTYHHVVIGCHLLVAIFLCAGSHFNVGRLINRNVALANVYLPHAKCTITIVLKPYRGHFSIFMTH